MTVMCIYDCLLTSMAAVQAEDVRAPFLFVGDPNGHHQDWLGSTATNSHGVAAVDFATVSGCDPFVVGPTHAHGGILDLLMTGVPDLIRVAVVEPIGNSGHSSLSAVISTAQAVLNFPETPETQAVPNLPETPGCSRNTKLMEYSRWCNAGSALA